MPELQSKTQNLELMHLGSVYSARRVWDFAAG